MSPSPAFETFFRYLPVAERDRKWGLHVTTVGESRIGPGVSYPPASHPEGYGFDWSRGRILCECQAVYISHGSGQLETRASGMHRIEAGLLFLLFPGVWHRYACDPQSGWTEHWLGFDGEFARRILEFFAPEQPVLRVRREELVLPLFTQAVQFTRANEPALQQILAGIAMQILGHLYSGRQAGLVASTRAAEFIDRAISRISSDLTAAIDFEALARQLNVSYRVFRRAFHEHTGLSPMQYLQELRIARARSLLTETELTAKEIALRCGFEDEHYFCRFFRKKQGITPGKWRAKMRAL